MGTRTVEASVRSVLGKDYDTGASGNRSLVPYIDAASVIVDKIALLCNAGDARELEMVERWLAAHLYGQSDKPFQSRSAKGSSASFAGKTEGGFKSTLYGQMAMRIDSSGYLWRLDERKEAHLHWLGGYGDYDNPGGIGPNLSGEGR